MSSSPNGKSCQTESSYPTADELSSRMQLIDHVARWLEEAGLSQAAIGQWKFNALAAAYPDDLMIQSVCQQASSLLGATQSLPEVGMTATDVSLQLSESLGRKIKPADINKALVDLGYQIRHEDKRIWELTEEGKEQGLSLLSTSKTNKWSGPQVKWYSSIIPILEAYFSNIGEQSDGSQSLNSQKLESKTRVSSAPKEASDSTVVTEVLKDDSAATTAYKASSKPKTEKESWFISDRLKFLKLKTTADMRMHIEMEAAEAYKEKHGKLPSKQLDKQKQCELYHEVDLEMLDTIIHKVMARYKNKA
ncbi:hypothetical protein [Allocoleopsis franciscana]|nr:hypothetical protein [Allocoleopsis franciscana]